MTPLNVYYRDGGRLIRVHTIQPKAGSTDWLAHARAAILVAPPVGERVHPLDIKVGDRLNQQPLEEGAFTVRAITKVATEGVYHKRGHVTFEYEGGFMTAYYNGDESWHSLYRLP